MYEFIGRVVGKALYDGILIGASFAPFFLKRWLGKRNYCTNILLIPALVKLIVTEVIFVTSGRPSIP
jgi:hypothetical protein